MMLATYGYGIPFVLISYILFRVVFKVDQALSDLCSPSTCIVYAKKVPTLCSPLMILQTYHLYAFGMEIHTLLDYHASIPTFAASIPGSFMCSAELTTGWRSTAETKPLETVNSSHIKGSQSWKLVNPGCAVQFIQPNHCSLTASH